MIQNCKTIFDLLNTEDFRKRTPMYLGEWSITRLKIFMLGFEMCERLNNLKSANIKPPFWLFYHWICQYYNHSGSYYNWDGIILQNCNNNEKKALHTFFERFDEFQQHRPTKILRVVLDKKAIDFFHSQKGRNWQIINQQQRRIGPATDLFMVEYNKNLGSTLYHVKDKKTLIASYYKTQIAAMTESEKEYGTFLNWEEISPTEFETIIPD